MVDANNTVLAKLKPASGKLPTLVATAQEPTFATYDEPLPSLFTPINIREMKFWSKSNEKLDGESTPEFDYA